MVYKCSVPFCKGNYDKGPKVSVFSLPKDEDFRKKWLNAIPRENMPPAKNFKVCELHFDPADIRRKSEYFDSKSGRILTADLSQPRLSEDAIPSIFPGCPQYMSKPNKTGREAPEKRAQRKECIEIEKALHLSENSFKAYEERISFRTLEELASKLNDVHIPDIYTTVKNKHAIMFLQILSSPVPELSLSISVNEKLLVSVFYQKIPVTEFDKHKFPLFINNVNELSSLLQQFVNFKESGCDKLNNLKSILVNAFDELKQILPKNSHDIIDFMSEQIALIGLAKTSFRYSADLLVLSSILHSISPHSYKFLRNRGVLILPHPNTLNRLTSSYNLDPRMQTIQDNFLMYAENKFKYLNDSDKHVNVMMDEIHLKPFLDFKGGDIIGASYNSGKAANSAFVFMVQSLKSTYKDVVHILPVKTITAELLHEILVILIKKLEIIGYHVICISSDNNAINRKAISMFSHPPKLSPCYFHPANSNRPLFYIIDAVHLLKSVRNNWLNQKNSEQAMFYPSFDNSSMDKVIDKTASFHSVKKLYAIEKDGMVKHAHTLTAKSLCPSSFEKQNVQLALNVFNLNVCESLKLVGPKNNIANAIDTADYIRIIVDWFDIMNVKSVFKGHHKRNIFQEPLTSKHDDDRFFFLHNFLNWLEKWENVKMDTGRLTRETLLALKQTTYAVIEIARYCIEELQFKYVLTGKLQTDSLESRFGKYRLLAGSQYNICLTQVYEVEKKIRLQSILPLSLKSNQEGHISVTLSNDDNNPNFDVNTDIPPFFNEIYVSDDDIKELNAMLPALVFVSGYCVHSMLKKINCQICKMQLLLDRDVIPDKDSFSLIKSLDRGGLKYPIDDVNIIVIYSYVVISKLLSEKYESIYLKVVNKRAVASKLILENLYATENYLSIETCSRGHTSTYLSKEICKKATNIFLKNYCKKVNDSLSFDALKNKKRKLMTLQTG